MRSTLALSLALVTLAACSEQPFTVDVPYRVTSVSPSPGATGVGRQPLIVVTFSEDVTPESVTSAETFKIEVIEDGGATAVSGTYEYGQRGEAPYAASFRPNRALPYFAKVRLTLSSGVKRARDGAPLPTPLTFEFETEAPPELGLVHVSPNDGVTNFERRGSVTLTFTEPVDCASFDGPVTFTENRTAHPNWTVAGPNPRSVPGSWDCPVLPEADARLLDGRCRASDSTDPVDYCKVTFTWAAGSSADLALAPSSSFTLTLPGLDQSTELGQIVRSRRAVKKVGDFGGEIRGALPSTLVIGGRTADPADLGLVSVSLSDTTRSAKLRATFTEPVRCASFAHVTVTELFDPQVAARRGASERQVSGIWSCPSTQSPESISCANDACTYEFTPSVPSGESVAFDWASRVRVTFDGRAQQGAESVESVRATSAKGQLVNSQSTEFSLAAPAAFTLVGSSPGAGAAGVAVDSPIALAFSHPPVCSASALQGVSVSVGSGASPVAGTWTCPLAPCPSGGCVATFEPASALPYATEVKVSLAGGPWSSGATLVGTESATSKGGNLSESIELVFRTLEPLPLVLLSSSPVTGAEQVSPSGPFSLVFNRPLDCASAIVCSGSNEATCTVRVSEEKDPRNGGATSLHTLGLDCSANTLSFVPQTALALSSKLSIELKSGLRAFDSGVLPSPTTLHWQTRDPDALVRVGTSPKSDVAPNGTMSIEFSRPLDCAQQASFTKSAQVAQHDSSGLLGGFAALGGDWTCSASSLHFTPASPVALSSVVRLSVGSSDVNSSVRTADATTRGGFLEAPVSEDFGIQNPAPLQLVSSKATHTPTHSILEFEFDRAVKCPPVPVVTLKRVSPESNIVLGTPSCSGSKVSVSTSAALSVGSNYRAELAAGLAATDATQVGTQKYGVLPSKVTLDFELPGAPLQVIAVSPAAGETHVKVSGVKVSWTFNQPIDRSSFVPCTGGNASTCNVEVSAPTGVVLSTDPSETNSNVYSVLLSQSGSTPLQKNTLHTLKLHGGAPKAPKNSNGLSVLNTDFTSAFTTTFDAVVSLTPANAATQVSPSSAVCAEFNDDVQLSSLSAGSLSLSPAVTLDSAVPYLISGTNGLQQNKLCLNIQSSGLPLAYGTSYTLTVSSGITFLKALSLATNATASFTTAAAPSSTVTLAFANSVASGSITNGAVDVPFNAAFTLGFAQPMGLGSFSASTVKLTNLSSNSGAGLTFTSSGSNVQTHTLMLSADTLYRLEVVGGPAGVKTSTGLPLTAGTSFHFRTSEETTVLAHTPAEPTFPANTQVEFITSRALAPAATSTASGCAHTTQRAGSILKFVPQGATVVSSCVFNLGNTLDERGNPIASFSVNKGLSATSSASPAALTAVNVWPEAGTYPLVAAHWALSFPAPATSGAVADRILPSSVEFGAGKALNMSASAGCTVPGLEFTFAPGTGSSGDTLEIELAEGESVSSGCTYTLQVDPSKFKNVLGQASSGASLSLPYVFTSP